MCGFPTLLKTAVLVRFAIVTIGGTKKSQKLLNFGWKYNLFLSRPIYIWAKRNEKLCISFVLPSSISAKPNPPEKKKDRPKTPNSFNAKAASGPTGHSQDTQGRCVLIHGWNGLQTVAWWIMWSVIQWRDSRSRCCVFFSLPLPTSPCTGLNAWC